MKHINFHRVLILILAILMLLSSQTASASNSENYESGGDELIRSYSRFSTNIPYEVYYNMQEPALKPGMLPFINSHLFKLSFMTGYDSYNLPAPLDNLNIMAPFDINIFAGVKREDMGIGFDISFNNSLYRYDLDTSEFNQFNFIFNIPMGFSTGPFAFGVQVGIEYEKIYSDKSLVSTRDAGRLNMNIGGDILIHIMDFLYAEAGIYTYLRLVNFQDDEKALLTNFKVPLACGLNLLDFITIHFEYAFLDYILRENDTYAIERKNYTSHRMSIGAQVDIAGWMPRFKLNYSYYPLELNEIWAYLPGSEDEKLNLATMEFGLAYDAIDYVYDFAMIFIPKGFLTNDFGMRIKLGLEF